MIKKKNSFWTFIFSFLPGAAEMYMGFMKNGVSLMLVFWGLVAVASIMEFGVFLYLAVVAWFYGFFHARNLAHLSEMELQQVKDQYLFVDNQSDIATLAAKHKKIIAIVLIVLGVALLWNSTLRMLWNIFPESIMTIIGQVGNMVPKVIIGICVIALGVKLIAGKKVELEHEQPGVERPELPVEESCENSAQ